MSKGSKIVPVRIDDDMYAEMEQAIKARNQRTREEPWKMSAFIRYCVRAELKHMKRGRASGRRNAKARKAGIECLP